MTVKKMEFTIDSSQTTNANGTAGVMSDIFKYTVPRHTALLFRPEDILSAYMKDAGAEAVGTDTFELVVCDSVPLVTEKMATGIYTTIKEFQDRNKTRKLGLNRAVKSEFNVILRFKATTVLVVTTCYFQLSCLRYAETL